LIENANNIPFRTYSQRSGQKFYFQRQNQLYKRPTDKQIPIAYGMKAKYLEIAHEL